MNEKLVFSCSEVEHRSNDENTRIKNNDEIIKEYKKNSKRNQSEVPMDNLNNSLTNLNNSLTNTSIIKEIPGRLNKLIFSKKELILEDMNIKKSLYYF